MSSLNIKSPRTVERVRELASRRKSTLVAAVDTAVEEALERDDKEQATREGRKGMAERIMAIARKTAPLMEGTPDSTHITDDLYDELGLPK
jgi:hypothetical protein